MLFNQNDKSVIVVFAVVRNFKFIFYTCPVLGPINSTQSPAQVSPNHDQDDKDFPDPDPRLIADDGRR